ncbi:antitoxin Xre/MbcA/ParS toxin-binding domain-containing protein [Chromobacterium vaccinii]|uniref:Antitoxin Xre/MbcA/ParS toxin-binding domain-containing protein n=1 Tax=Chromobacterium vaccinii TaxID=1108595 RepID=A0ABV0FAJ9_9NEIS
MSQALFKPDAGSLPEQPRAPTLRFARLSRIIGQRVRSDLEVARYVANGADTGLIDHLADEGLTRKELEFVIPARTLSHRIKKHEKLSRDESERGVRVASLLVLAQQVLGEEATGWLRQPLRRFDDASPLEMAQTEQGARLVENLLVQIDEGYVA